MRPLWGRLFAGAGAGARGAAGASVIGGATASGDGTSALSSTASGSSKSGSVWGGETGTGDTLGAVATFVREGEFRRAIPFGRGAGFFKARGAGGSGGMSRASRGGRCGGASGRCTHEPDNIRACSSTEPKTAAMKRNERRVVTAALRAGSRPARSVRRCSPRSASLPEGGDAEARARFRSPNRPGRAA